MFIKRSLACFVLLVVLLFSSACGAPAATSAPAMPEAPAASRATARNESQPVAPAATQSQSAAPGSSKSGMQPPNGQSAGDMFFQNYGVNPQVDTEDDHLSTFALDVDTGAYTIMRRYVSDGNLPPKDAIRVEEFVNYFNQDYPIPSEHQAFGISVDGAPTPYGETERYQMLRVGIQGYSVPAEQRKDVSLTFVIDVSGSMSQENRLDLVKRSLELLVEQLRPSDQVSIVVYGTEA